MEEDVEESVPGTQDRSLGNPFTRFWDKRKLFPSSRELDCFYCGDDIKEGDMVAVISGNSLASIDLSCERCYWDRKNELREKEQEEKEEWTWRRFFSAAWFSVRKFLLVLFISFIILTAVIFLISVYQTMNV